jgi:hypothetical protein
MSHNVEAVMQKPLDVNSITLMWLKIQLSTLLVLNLNEYIKVVEIAMVKNLGSIEDERTFNNLIFMKNKLRNRLTTHFNLCVRMFT